MRRLVTAAISAAIITTTAWSQVKTAEANPFIEELLVACGIGCLRFVPIAQQITSRVIAVANANKSPFGYENTILAYLGALGGTPPVFINPQLFAGCNANNIFKTASLTCR
jgi:hypothetical protein